jgi:L-arabinose isomerase
MEDYTYDLTPGAEVILGAHMLEICPSLTTSTPRIEVHPLAIGGREDPVRMVFQADPGEGVVVSLADLRDRLRMTANVVDLVPSGDLRRLPVARAVWRPRPDFTTSAECWLTAGGAHHTVLSTAAGVDAFREFARLTEVELLVIDEHTTGTTFANEVRWNQAYYRLSQDL